MRYTENLFASQRAGLDRALDQYHWRLAYDATKPYYEDEEDEFEEEEDEE